MQEAINIAARLFLGPGAIALVETPCYQGAAFAFQASGAELIGVPVDDERVAHRSVARGAGCLLYLTPSHQYPTGYVLSLERAERLIAWARRKRLLHS